MLTGESVELSRHDRVDDDVWAGELSLVRRDHVLTSSVLFC